MVSAGLQILGICQATLGFLGSSIVCGLPKWKVTAFIGSNIVTKQNFWEGLWMNCVVQSTGQMQCKVYDILLALPQDLQGTQALVIIAIIADIATRMTFFLMTDIVRGQGSYNCLSRSILQNIFYYVAQRNIISESSFIIIYTIFK
ncbi:claudin-4-like [Carassius auratus]|uniref:Claudin n=1 Tax=Carassius auratus TaxID=7957 RepID=A0A6P6M0G5_CARAU|nr:claudin-4-like [Carassius auratus]